MEFISVSWTSVESKNALSNFLAKEGATSELATADPNTWGFFPLPNGKKLVVGYANLGLTPVATVVNGHLLIGINEILAGFDLNTLQRTFIYRMPSVFHEFVSLKDPVIVRDEVGFICISATGVERWALLTNGPINQFTIEGAFIRGVTIDDEPFKFAIPS
ncbi:hypothetical protein [Anthocerotibacter panamensis]|uniref:hypothetical protein n=1 Tax=Anthocerotibacter panamensis TaxID=2857077 RepID=UPI001C402186|nr:hypothetical protein [Anthocerotibacter panamensis]